MAISIDWGTRVITVPKADMELVHSFPFEVRELDLNEFHLTLRNLEDDIEGMAYPSTHNHNTEVSLGGVVLSRVVEIINDYTVTFENGNYAVNLVGANSNVADVTNLNSVSIRSANSAGLITVGGVDPSDIANAVFDEPLSGHTDPDTIGPMLSGISSDIGSVSTDLSDLSSDIADQTLLMRRILGLTQENFYIDQPVYSEYEGQKLLTSGRIRTYSEAVNVGTDTGVLATYAITATYLNGAMRTYKVTLQ